MKQIEINPSNEYHILRHFESVPEEYKTALIGKEYYYYNHQIETFQKSLIIRDDIESALRTKGSKFFEGIPGISTPRDLLKIIQLEFGNIPKETMTWGIKEGHRLFSFLINYKYPVGYKNLIDISTLPPDTRKLVRKVPRSANAGEDTIMVNVIENVPAKIIKTIEVGIDDREELPFLFCTAYPGDLEDTPDFPNPKQSEKDYEISNRYWDNHAFIISR